MKSVSSPNATSMFYMSVVAAYPHLLIVDRKIQIKPKLNISVHKRTNLTFQDKNVCLYMGNANIKLLLLAFR